MKMVYFVKKATSISSTFITNKLPRVYCVLRDERFYQIFGTES